MPWIAAVVMVLLTAFSSYLFSNELDRQIQAQKEQVRQWDDKISLIKADIPKITVIKDRLNQRPAEFLFLAGAARDDTRMTKILDGIERARPASVTLTHLHYQPDGLALDLSATATGADGTPAVHRYEAGLSRLSWCDRLHAAPIQSSPQFADAVEVQIAIRCKRL